MLFVLGAALLALWIYIAYLGADLNRAADQRLSGGSTRAEPETATTPGTLASG